MHKITQTALVLSVFVACSAPNETGVDPFDTTTLPRISLTERAQIESGEGADQIVLHQVSGAIVLRSGEVAVANVNSQVLVFGPDGDLHRTVGRSGGGPGEFRFLQKIVGLDGDRLLAWDPAQARVTVFRRDGELDYTCTPQGIDLARVGGGFVAAFADGSFVLEGSSAWNSNPNATDGLRSDTIPYLLFDPSGAFVRTIGKFARSARSYSANSGYERYLLDTSVFAVISSGQLLVGENDSIALTRFDSSGATLPRLTLPRTPRPVTEADIEAGWEEWLEQRVVAREQMLSQAMMTLDENALLAMRDRIRAEVEADLAEARRTIEPAEFLPAYRSLVVGSDGLLWVEDYLSPTQDISRWVLLGADFAPLGWMELPRSEQLLAAGPNTLVILRKDDFGIESVVLMDGDWPPVHAGHD